MYVKVYFQCSKYQEAFELLGKSEALFFRSAGADAHFMAQYIFTSQPADSSWLFLASIMLMATSSMLKKDGSRPSGRTKRAFKLGLQPG